jgi:endoglucanase
MKQKIAFIILTLLCSFYNFSQIVTTQFNTLIQSNHNFGLANPLWDDVNCNMSYIPTQVTTNGAAFSFNFVNPGGNGFKGYPSGTVGGFKQGSTYYPGNVITSGLPVQISNLNQNLRLKWKASQLNANDVDDKWWATINVIFDNTAPNLEPIQANRDYDLVIQLKSYEQEDFTDVLSSGNNVYWYYARNNDNSLKTFDLFIDGNLYQWAVRYKFFSYPIGDPNEDKNDKVHIKFIPINNNNVAPYLDHSLKLFIDTTYDYLQYVNLSPAEAILAQQKVADPNLWIKSVSAGYEVYTGTFTVKNDYFYTIIDNTLPSTPLNLIGSEISGTFQLNWDNISDLDVDSYKVYRATNNGPFQLIAQNVYYPTFTDTNFNNVNNYTYYVVSQDRSFNLSLPSNQVFSSAITPQNMVAMMGTGINLGNIFSAPFEGNWAAPLTEEYVDNVYRLGFKHVRIPIRFDNQTTPFSSVTYTDGFGNYIGSPSNYFVNTTYLDRIEQIINWCLARNLIAIIDVHGDHWFWESFDSSSSYYVTGNDRLAKIDRFKAIWRDISLRFQNKPDTVLFEIMNEPYFSMSATEVIDINTQILSIIRATNPYRNVIVTGGGINSYQAPLQLSDSFLQSDNHIIITFHYYQPFSFTSSASANQNDNDWGTNSDINNMEMHFNTVQSWANSKNVAIYLGEFGADNENGFDYSTNAYGTNGGPDVQSRYLYHYHVAKAARERGFALAVWDAGEKAGKSLYLNSTQNWVKDVRNAVLDASCTNEIFINNANVNCNYDYSWSVDFGTGASGRLYNAKQVDYYLNTPTLNVEVQSSNGNFNNVIVSNEIFTTGIVVGQNYNVSCVAKGDSNQEMKIRVKMVVNGSTIFLTSPAYLLTNTFLPFTYNFSIPNNTSSVQVQILCGKHTGNYYFDDFQVVSTLSDEDFDNNDSNFVIYPNPAQKYFQIANLEDVMNVELFSIDGKKIPLKNENNQFFFDALLNGIYILIIHTNDKIITNKLIIKN